MNAETQEKKPTLDLGAMMDQTLDTIPEAADFVIPPPGLYRLKCTDAKVDKYETKKEPGVQKQRLKMMYSIVATVQLASDKEPPVPDGSLFSETFQATEDGLSYFKKRIREVLNAEDTAGVTLADMMNSVKEQEFDARLTIRKSENPADKDNPYENVSLRVVPPKA